MKPYVQRMNAAERRAYRRWQLGWACIYATIFALLAVVSAFLPAPGDIATTQVSQKAFGDR